MNDFFTRLRATLRRHSSAPQAVTDDETSVDKRLVQIGKALEINYPDIYASLKPGANDAELGRLKDICFDGQNFPAELGALYQWRNGQTGYGSLNPEDNHTFLSIDDTIDAWQFLNDPMEDILQPISKHWIPITYNGAGDYLMYIAKESNIGGLVSYWHDDTDRHIEHPNLIHWAEAVLTAAQTPPNLRPEQR